MHSGRSPLRSRGGEPLPPPPSSSRPSRGGRLGPTLDLVMNAIPYDLETGELRRQQHPTTAAAAAAQRTPTRQQRRSPQSTPRSNRGRRGSEGAAARRPLSSASSAATPQRKKKKKARKNSVSDGERQQQQHHRRESVEDGAADAAAAAPAAGRQSAAAAAAGGGVSGGGAAAEPPARWQRSPPPPPLAPFKRPSPALPPRDAPQPSSSRGSRISSPQSGDASSGSPEAPLTLEETMLLCGVHPGSAGAGWFCDVRAQRHRQPKASAAAAAAAAAACESRWHSLNEQLKEAQRSPAVPLQAPSSGRGGAATGDIFAANKSPVSAGVSSSQGIESSRSGGYRVVYSDEEDVEEEEEGGPEEGSEDGTIRRHNLKTADRELISQFDRLTEQRRLLSVKRPMGGPRGRPGDGSHRSGEDSASDAQSPRPVQQTRVYGQLPPLSTVSTSSQHSHRSTHWRNDDVLRVVVLSLGPISPIYRANHDYYSLPLPATEPPPGRRRNTDTGHERDVAGVGGEGHGEGRRHSHSHPPQHRGDSSSYTLLHDPYHPYNPYDGHNSRSVSPPVWNDTRRRESVEAAAAAEEEEDPWPRSGGGRNRSHRPVGGRLGAVVDDNRRGVHLPPL